MQRNLDLKHKEFFQSILEQGISLSNPSDFHKYIYVYNRPLFFIDPTGYKGCKPPCKMPPKRFYDTLKKCYEVFREGQDTCPLCPYPQAATCFSAWKKWMEECALVARD